MFQFAYTLPRQKQYSPVNLIVAPYIFAESLQFINQQIHI